MAKKDYLNLRGLTTYDFESKQYVKDQISNGIDNLRTTAYKTEAEWSKANPVLKKGEWAYSSDKAGMYKLGNGTSKWSELSYNHVTWENVEGKPSTFSPTAHKHTKSDITDFPSAMKNPNTLTIKTNGTSQAVYDGGVAKEVNITASSIGLGNVNNTADSNKTVLASTYALKLRTYRTGSTTETYGDQYPLFAQWDAKNNLRLVCSGYTVATNYADSAGSVAWGNVSGKPSTYTPSSHTHTKSQITDFPSSMPASDVYSWAKASSKPSYSWNEITGKPSTFIPSSHSHVNITSSGRKDPVVSGTTPNDPSTEVTLSGLSMSEFYGVGSNSPCPYGNVINVMGSSSSGAGELLLEWSGSDSTTGRLYYRSHRDTKTGGWGAWKTVAYTSDIPSTIAWDKVTGKPSTYPATAHTHDDRYYTESEVNGKLSKYLPLTGGTVSGFITASHATANDIGFEAKNTDSGKSVAFIVGSGKQNRGVYDRSGNKWMLYADANDNVYLNGAASYVPWSGVTGKPSTFTPSSHTHDDRYYTETEINDKVTALNNSIATKVTEKTITTATDFNTFTTTGIYHICVSTNSNLHAPTTNHGTLIVDFSVGTPYQIWIPDNVVDAQYKRTYTKSSSTWSGWTTQKLTDTVYTHPSYTAYTSGLYKITTNSLGHVTSATAVTKGDITALGIPGSNTDSKVLQTAVKSSDYTNWRTVLWGASNSGTEGFTPTTVTDNVFSSQTLTFQPSTGTLKANTFKGNLSGNATSATSATTATKLATARTISLTGSVTGSGSFDGSGNLSIATTTNHTHNYSSLTGTPTIGNGTITIKQNGTQKATFTMNQTGNTTVELTDTNTNTWRGIQNNLTSDSTSDSLAAAQGKALKGMVDAVDKKVDNLEVGGRNLLRSTKTFESPFNLQGSAKTPVKDIDGFYYVSILDTWNNHIRQTIQLEKETYIISFYAKSSENVYVEIKDDGAANTVLGEVMVDSVAWKRYAVRFTVKDNTNKSVVALLTRQKNTTIYIKRLKLERGNKATDWTPAPEDIDDSISSLSSRIITNTNSISSLKTTVSNKLDTSIFENYKSHTHKYVIDSGNSSYTLSFAYSKAGMNYDDYSWLAGWNGCELRAVNKNQFATAGHNHDSVYSKLGHGHAIADVSGLQGSLDGKLSLSGGTMSGILNFDENKLAINFRPSSAVYYTGLMYQNAGNEALVFSARNAVTSFIFKSGQDPTSMTSSTWQSMTPSVQIKGQSLYVNSLIANGVTPSYNFYVKGEGCIDGDFRTSGVFRNFGGWSCAGNGNYNYCKICTIKITGSYCNYPISLEISGRGLFTSVVTIIFQNMEGTDPNISTFSSTGNRDFYIKKTATSTWEVYGKYSESWGNLHLNRIFGSGASCGGFQIIYNMENISVLPDGCTKAVFDGGAKYSEYIANDSNYMRFHWSGQSGQPTWLWGGNDSSHMYVYNPSNFNVNYAKSAGTSGSCTGNASTATKLATARSINGTNFDGSGNITTANWGTARTITIGNTGKSVNGGGNVSWSLSEIGAAASSHSHNYAGSSSAGGSATSAVKLDTATAGSATQPVYFSGGKPVACTYTLGKSVPSNAVFTDTNTWRGIQNNLTSDSTSDSLSAAQGKVLKGLVDGKANTSHTHTKSQITDFPSSMPASDVYAWAKASSKPSYSWGEITGKPSSFTPSSHTHNYLPLSGGTVTGNTTFNNGVTIKEAGVELYYTTPFIDFHYKNDSSVDYTSRIIELEKGKLNVNGTVCSNDGSLWCTSFSTDGGVNARLESTFSSGTYTDPLPGVSCGIKVSGMATATRFYVRGRSGTWLSSAQPGGAGFECVNDTIDSALIPGWRIRNLSGAWVGASYNMDKAFHLYYAKAERLSGNTDNGTDADFIFNGRTGNFSAKSITQTSDERRKSVISSSILDIYKDFFMKIKPFSFKWKDGQDDTATHLGVGAQSVFHTALECGFEESDIGLVQRGKEYPGTSIPWSVSYTEFIPLNIAVTQDHETRIEKLERENEELKQQIKELKGLTA